MYDQNRPIFQTQKNVQLVTRSMFEEEENLFLRPLPVYYKSNLDTEQI